MELPKPVREFANTVMCFYEYGKLAVIQTLDKADQKLADSCNGPEDE